MLRSFCFRIRGCGNSASGLEEGGSKEDSLGFRGFSDLVGFGGFSDLVGFRGFSDLVGFRGFRDLVGFSDLVGFRGFSDLVGFRGFSDLVGFRGFSDFELLYVVACVVEMSFLFDFLDTVDTEGLEVPTLIL
ncbi:unnamed protein product [Arctia plantaginis]|uniref:Uncharacterized protein n=1 Tax=Arctia plantaginis TaxID=874455 RepID=A0A8S1BH49_ARCPL|nr:unnamed protein product [Arctia plantaginis]